MNLGACEIDRRLGAGRWAALVAFLLALVVLPACHLPTPLKELDEPRLATVQEDYQYVVELAYTHPTQTWYSGWMGNFWRNWHKGHRRGLCYEWQAVVYEAVRESAPKAGFVAIGIMKDRNKSSEHHAVLLFERGDIVTSQAGATTGPEAGLVLLAQREPRRAWVLDPWRYGRADVFWLDDWLGSDIHWRGRIEFEDLEAEYRARVEKVERKKIEVFSDGSARTGPPAANSGM
jgi:hypothetical protein